MTDHANDDHIDKLLDSIDFNNDADIANFCRECEKVFVTSSPVSMADLSVFLGDCPSVRDYMESGDYVGATSRIALAGLFSYLSNGSAPIEENLLRETGIQDMLDEHPLFKDEGTAFSIAALVTATGKTMSHVCTCPSHDVKSAFALFEELRYCIGQNVFNITDKYLEIAKNIGMLILGAQAAKGAGFLEKNPLLTYHGAEIARLLDEASMPMSSIGMQVMDTIRSAKNAEGKSYAAYISALLSIAMIAINFGTVDITSAKSINDAVTNYMTALQDVA